jgi:hypothetical protein
MDHRSFILSFIHLFIYSFGEIGRLHIGRYIVT